MIKNIIFDLGGVILKHRADLIGHILSKMFPVSEEYGNSLWIKHRMKLLKGELSSEEFLKKLKDKFEIQLSVTELSQMWRDLYVENAKVDWKVLEFVEQLKNKYKVYLLTDTIDIHDQYNKTRNIYNKFEKVFKSHQEKLAKAEGKKFFSHVLKKINAKSEECVFIDDLEEQVKTAESLGIKGIVYKTLPQLKKELNNLGIVS